MSSIPSILVFYFIAKLHIFFVATQMLIGVVIWTIANPLLCILFSSAPTPSVGVLENKRLWLVHPSMLNIGRWQLLPLILHGFSLSLMNLVLHFILLHCFFVTMLVLRSSVSILSCILGWNTLHLIFTLLVTMSIVVDCGLHTFILMISWQIY